MDVTDNITITTKVKTVQSFIAVIKDKGMYKPQLKQGKYRRSPRYKLTRNAFSPYMEGETKAIKRTNFIITDPRRMSRLGWLSQQEMDERELQRLMASIGVVF